MIYVFGDYRIDSARFEIACGDTTLPIEPQVLDLLIALLDHRDRVLTHDELIEQVWKGRIVSDTTLHSRIKTARQAIGDDGTHQRWIRTIHGRGFRFVGEVVAEPDEQAVAGRANAGAVSRPVTRYARSGKVHIAYHLFGGGPVNLVLTPGFVSHIDNYWEQPNLNGMLCALGAHARVAMFDKRGTGMSDKVDALPSMDERMDDVRAVMDAAGFDSAFVLGISEGGSLAALFAAYHPRRCDGLILYGSFAKFRYWHRDAASLQKLFDYVEADWGSGKSLRWYAPSVADDPAFVEWWGRFERLGATPGAVIALMKMNSQIDISDILPSIRVPTLVIHRTDDVLVDVEAGRELGAQIPGASYVELRGCDHIPWAGANCDQIGAAVLDFLERPRRPPEPDLLLATVLLLRFDPGTSAARADAVTSAVRNRLGCCRASHTLAERPTMLAATFDAPARALECAHGLSMFLRDEGVTHRIAVHAGEIDLSADVLDGATVQVANDIAGFADADQVLVSRTVHDLIAGSGAELEDVGRFQLPCIAQSWRLYRLMHA